MTAYEMRISDWSSDVCSSDLFAFQYGGPHLAHPAQGGAHLLVAFGERVGHRLDFDLALANGLAGPLPGFAVDRLQEQLGVAAAQHGFGELRSIAVPHLAKRSEEHTSELQSLMRISYAVFCLKKKTKK